MADRLDQTQLDILRAMDSIEVSGLVSKQYVAAEKRVVFSRGATVKLNLRLASHYTVVTFAKRDALIAWFDVDDFTDDYVADDITFIDLNTKKVISGKSYTFKYQTTGMKSVYGEGPDPIGEVKGKIWVPFTRLSELPAKNMRIGLFTDIAAGDRIEWVIKKDGFEVKEWAVVIGTSSGFVTAAPTADPNGSNGSIDGTSVATQDISPADAALITEVGFYAANDNGDGETVQIGLYDDQGDPEGPYDLLFSTTFTRGTTGWQSKSGLSWSISPSTSYYLALSHPGVGGVPYTDYVSYGPGSGYYYSTYSNFPLPDPWLNNRVENRSYSIYALCEAGGNPPNGHLNGPFSGCFGGPV